MAVAVLIAVTGVRAADAPAYAVAEGWQVGGTGGWDT
jgi:hypothetical protein